MLDPEDFDAIVSALNAGSQRPSPRWDADGHTARLNRLLELANEQQASDLILIAGAPPSVRVDGAVTPLEDAFGVPLTSRDIEDIIVPAIPAHARRSYDEQRGADWTHRLADLGRFRINVHHERGRIAATVRRLASNVPVLGSLHLPEATEALTRLQHGLVLIAGPAGSGRTTTMAALVNDINQREARHIITIEDPIEYEHSHGRALVEQVEVGVDAPDFAAALRAALRRGADVVVIGELRDAETMQIALAAGEAGQLVLACLRAPDAPTAAARIVESFPADRQGMIRQSLAMALSAVLTQTLMPRRGGGLVPAVELLMVEHGARQRIRKNTLRSLHKEVVATRGHGSFTLEECLADLVKRELIDGTDAATRATRPAELQRLLS